MTQETVPPMESPRSFNSVTKAVIFSVALRSGQRTMLLSISDVVIVSKSTVSASISPTLLTQATISILYFSFSTLAAIAPEATVPMVSLALDRPPPDEALMPYFIW